MAAGVCWPSRGGGVRGSCATMRFVGAGTCQIMHFAATGTCTTRRFKDAKTCQIMHFETTRTCTTRRFGKKGRPGRRQAGCSPRKRQDAAGCCCSPTMSTPTRKQTGTPSPSGQPTSGRSKGSGGNSTTTSPEGGAKKQPRGEKNAFCLPNQKETLNFALCALCWRRTHGFPRERPGVDLTHLYYITQPIKV